MRPIFSQFANLAYQDTIKRIRPPPHFGSIPIICCHLANREQDPQMMRMLVCSSRPQIYGSDTVRQVGTETSLSKPSLQLCMVRSSDLPFDKFLENPVSLHEFSEGTALNNFPGFQYVDSISLLQRGQAMGDHHPG